ncbi:MAG: (5-formylfuran-3-yl)methyl phosphate synthase, partial [Planctomycetaceae bacterium]
MKDEGDRSPIRLPRLLVSVRDAFEAREALAGGCEILDVKEPSRGPLGMASVEMICEIHLQSRRLTVAGPAAGLPPAVADVALSAALGETLDWLNRGHVPSLPGELDFLKLGPAGLSRITDWIERWQSVRAAFNQSRAVPARSGAARPGS